MKFDLAELSKPLTATKADALAIECASERMQRDFMAEEGKRTGRGRAWILWRDVFIAYATGKPWAFALKGIRVANLALRGAT